MPFLNTSWFALIVSLTIALIVSTGHRAPNLTNGNWLYFGIELLILFVVGFIGFRFIVSTILRLSSTA